MPLLKTANNQTKRLEDFEDILEARATLSRLKKGLTEAVAKETEANAKLSKKALTTAERAQQLIKGEASESDGRDWQVERRKRVENSEAHAAAVEEQAKTLHFIEQQRSRDLCASVEPEYRVLVQNVVATVGAALQAEGRARKFKTALAQEGVLQVHDLLPTEPLAVEQLTAWLARARAQGYDA